MELVFFFLGAAFGWGVEWVIDRYYWRGLGTRPPADNAFKADLSALRTRFDDSQEKIALYETEVEDLRAQLKETTPADTYELHEKLRAANVEIATLKAAIPETTTDNSLATELAEAKAMIERLQSENNTSPLIALNELQAKLDEAETELAGYRSVEEITRIEIQELRQKVVNAEKNTGGKSRGAANEEIAGLLQQIEARDHEIASLKSGSSANSSEEVETLKTKASQADYFSRQLENARSTIAMLEQEMLRPASSSGADDELRRKNTELQTEMLRLKSGFESQSEEIESLKTQIQERERNIQSMASLDELADARNRANAAEERVTALMTEQQNVLTEIESMRKQAVVVETDENLTASMRQEIEDLSAKLAGRDQIVSETRSEFNSLNAKLHASQAELEDLRTSRSARDGELQTLRDELSTLKTELNEREGLEAKLKTAEIELEAYDDLKSAKEQLQDRVGQLEGELADAKAQAKEAELEAKTREAEKAAAEVAQLRAHLDHHRTALAHALSQLDIFDTAPVAVSTVAQAAPTPPPVPEAAPEAPPQVTANRDPLEKLKGVGFVYERKLWDAGILTFSDLANASVEEVTAAIAPEEWQQIDPESWITEAKKHANGG